VPAVYKGVFQKEFSRLRLVIGPCFNGVLAHPSRRVVPEPFALHQSRLCDRPFELVTELVSAAKEQRALRSSIERNFGMSM
jgi:hypothetical protein